MGPKGIIVKIIRFDYLENDRWNLGFGDFRRGELDDFTTSNNQDLVKIINTIAQSVYIFMETNPGQIVEIKPADEKRKQLFNRIFARRWPEIESFFLVLGIVDGQREAYSPDGFYDSFEVSSKF